jgi:hypothetical protein
LQILEGRETNAAKAQLFVSPDLSNSNDRQKFVDVVNLLEHVVGRF